MNYTIRDDESDKIVSLVYEHLSEKDEINKFEELALDIASTYRASPFGLTEKQQDVVGAIYYRQIFKYRKPTKKMLEEARVAHAARLAESREFIESMFGEEDESDS